MEDNQFSVDTMTTTTSKLIPDFEDDPADILLSFPDIKAKTTLTLYQGGALDRSPKGSVDEPIRPLVDLINRHPSFSTLSSCSGRISLFQPWGRTTGINSTEEEGGNEMPEEKNVPDSGKGRGGWLLVSHEVIEHSQLLTIFQTSTDEEDDTAEAPNDDEEKILVFKVEPMLLHVAAATHERGRQLLALALELGFRESGLVIPSRRSNHRVTVAIRGVSLALSVPLAFEGALRPSVAYLRALVDQSNVRMERNQAKLQRLFESVQRNLFAPYSSSLGTSSRWNCTPLPDLNVWGHNAVVFPAVGPNAKTFEVDLLVFGGCGHGPLPADQEEDRSRYSCKRLGTIHCLKQREGKWEPDWITVLQPQPTGDPSPTSIRFDALGIDVKQANFTPREGSAVFAIDNSQWNGSTVNTIVGIWGGRKGPHRPLGDFLLYDHSDKRVVSPSDIRGELPGPRWGHSLTRLKSQSKDPNSVQRLALLLGGRNEREALNTAHVLSLVSGSGSGHFLWETIEFAPNQPEIGSLPFNHATIVIPDDESVSVFVFGGLSNPCDLLNAFASSGPLEVPEKRSCHTLSSFSLSMDASSGLKARPFTLTLASNLSQDFGVGGAMTLLEGVFAKQESTQVDHHLLLWSGGAPSDTGNQQDADQNAAPFQLVELAKSRVVESTEKQWILRPSPMSIPSNLGGLEESVLVHHCSLAVPSHCINEMELVLVGGGVVGFAFGPCFSSCYGLRVLGPDAQTLRNGPASSTASTAKAAAPQQNIARKQNAPALDTSAKAPPTDVVYVRKRNAKAVKTALEKLNLLDKRFRMIPVDGFEEESGKEIAVPITEDCLHLLSNANSKKSMEWASLVEGMGQQEMPFSTSQFARKKKT